jgi:GT2 family glycosyltransferase
MVYSYPELIDEMGKVIPNDLPVVFPSGSVFLDFVKRNRIATPSATLIRRKIFYDTGFFDESREYFCGEDYDLWLRIAQKHKIVFCPGRLTSYRVRETGISRNLVNAMKGDFYVLRKLLVRHSEPAGGRVDKAFYRAFDYNLYHTFRRYAFGYHYGLENRNEAAALLLTALSRRQFYRNLENKPPCKSLYLFFNRSLPYYWIDFLYLGFFCLPEPFFNFLRKMKRKAVSSYVPAKI